MIEKYDLIVPVSGGKDSQACLKMAALTGKKVIGLFCDTKYEHPITYQHIEKLKIIYGVDIHVIAHGRTPLELSVKNGRFPSDIARHCTDALKIRQTRIFLDEYSKQYGGVELWYGMRSGESHARRKRYEDKTSSMIFSPHELMPKKYPKFLAKRGVYFRLPILDWSDDEVFDYLVDEHNPLYDNGFNRVGCFPCLAAGDKWKESAFSFDDFGKKARLDVGVVEQAIGKSVFTSKGGKARDAAQQGCLICSI